MTKTANSAGVRPIQPYQLDPRRNHDIRVAVQRRMNQYVALSCAYATNVSRFLKGACQHYGRIRAQMTVPGQTETARQRLYSRGDAAEVRVVDGLRHVQSGSEDDTTHKDKRIICLAPFRPSQVRTRQCARNDSLFI